MTKPALLIHPPLGLFESRLGEFDVVHWPTDRKDVRAAVTIGHVGISNAMIDARRADDCLSSGRRNCNPIEAPQR